MEGGRCGKPRFRPRAGNIYAGLWYPIAVALMTVAVGALFLRETKDRSIHE